MPAASMNADNQSSNKSQFLVKDDQNGNDYLIDISGLSEEDDDDDEEFSPSELFAKKDCVRYNGKIKLGLFKGIWLLNYAFGCKNRVNRVSSNFLLYYIVFIEQNYTACCSEDVLYAFPY